MQNLLDADLVHIVYITIPRDEGKNLARKLVEKRLVACVNIVSVVESYFWWKGSVKHDVESLLICKTTVAKFQDLMAYVHEVHPYDVPEIIAYPVATGHPDYIAWIHKETEG